MENSTIAGIVIFLLLIAGALFGDDSSGWNDHYYCDCDDDCY